MNKIVLYNNDNSKIEINNINLTSGKDFYNNASFLVSIEDRLISVKVINVEYCYIIFNNIKYNIYDFKINIFPYSGSNRFYLSISSDNVLINKYRRDKLIKLLYV